MNAHHLDIKDLSQMNTQRLDGSIVLCSAPAAGAWEGCALRRRSTPETPPGHRERSLCPTQRAVFTGPVVEWKRFNLIWNRSNSRSVNRLGDTPWQILARACRAGRPFELISLKMLWNYNGCVKATVFLIAPITAAPVSSAGHSHSLASCADCCYETLFTSAQ